MSGLRVKDSRWLKYALASWLFFGITNFILGFIAEKSAKTIAASVHAVSLLWLGVGILGAAAAVFFRVNGRGFFGLGEKYSYALPVAAGITLALGMLFLKTGLAADPLAKGPVVAVTSTNSLVVAVLALVFLKERLTLAQWGGLWVIAAGILLVSVGGSSNAHFGAVGFGVAAMVLFGLTNFLLKLAGRLGNDSISTAVVLWLAVGACGLLALGWRLAERTHWTVISDPGLNWLALAAGIFLALGMLGIKKAVTLGPAGPAAAVSGSNAVLVGLLDYLILGHWPQTLKLAGMLTAIAGIAIFGLIKPAGK